MSLILEQFQRYDVEYDVKDKYLFIRKPIPVKDFVYLRQLIKLAKEPVDEILVV